MRVLIGCRYLVVGALIALTTTAHADPAGVPPLPIARDLSTVAIGSWAEYAISGSSSTIRWAVVGRSAQGTTLEVAVADAELGKGKRGAIVQRMTVAAGTELATQNAAIQIADADPLEVSSNKQRFAGVDAGKKTAAEDITVKAGAFSATRYRQVTARGTLDYWVADNAGPIGIVKLTFTVPATAKVIKKRAAGPVTIELVKTGTDAKPAIVKPVVGLRKADLGAMRAKLGTGPGTPVFKPRKPIAPIKRVPGKGTP